MDGTPPKANGSNGDRDQRGRFTPGNQAARGRRHPHAARVARLRAALLQTVSDEDVRDIVRRIVQEAKGGNLKAAAWILDRVVGKPVELLDALVRIRAGQDWISCPLSTEARELLAGAREADPAAPQPQQPTATDAMRALAAGLKGTDSAPPGDAG